MKLSKECFDNKKIIICNKIYNCHIVKDLASKTDNNGEIEYRTENINIDEKLLNQPLTFLEVLLHEIQHGINERYGLDKINDEENFTKLQGIALSTVFFINPWVLDVAVNCVKE